MARETGIARCGTHTVVDLEDLPVGGMWKHLTLDHCLEKISPVNLYVMTTFLKPTKNSQETSIKIIIALTPTHNA